MKEECAVFDNDEAEDFEIVLVFCTGAFFLIKCRYLKRIDGIL